MTETDGPASRAYREGNAFARAGDRAAAAERFRAALAIDPMHAAALNNLGTLLRAAGDVPAAIACYRRALVARPDLVGTIHNLATALLQAHRPHAAVSVMRDALETAGDDAESWNLFGGAHLALDRPAEAGVAFDRALAIDPDLVNARVGAAIALLMLGDLRAGFAAYEIRWSDPAFRAEERHFSAPLWRGDDLAGKTVLVHAEQGLGDTIQFARYVPCLEARGARVVLMVQPSLVTLFADWETTVLALDATPPPFDVHCPLLSLPHRLGTDLDTIPPPVPMAPDIGRVAAWEDRLGRKIRPRVGFAFSGSADHPDDLPRSIFARDMVDALAGVPVDLHVLQTEIRPRDAACLAAIPFVTSHAERLTDFAATAALAAHMDLVVSVDTSVAHLAATLGRPTWVLVQFAADWRWLRERTDSPWYPSARLFRQPALGDWTSVLADVAAAIRAWHASLDA